MAQYVATVKGGLHANYSSLLDSVEPWNLINDHRRAAQALAHKGDFEARTLLNTLVGAAPGATATYNYAEIEPNVEMGGKRNVIQTPLVNRVTTANDASDLKNEIGALSANSFTPVPVPNGDRNPLGTR